MEQRAWGGRVGPRLLIGKREGGRERPEKHKGGQPRARTGTRSRAGGEQGEGRRREEEGKR